MEARLIQVIKCKCGKTFAACCEPECYTDKDWQKDVRNYVKKGCTVEMREAGQWNFERCTCVKQEEKELSLFS